uniref:Uncharacterized protein n=1 Tax=Anguilla anguilla TaxID=7936 RepID=A0A0E9XLC5_ANGAN
MAVKKDLWHFMLIELFYNQLKKRLRHPGLYVPAFPF